jgi:hypothetical protein
MAFCFPFVCIRVNSWLSIGGSEAVEPEDSWRNGEVEYFNRSTGLSLAKLAA